jgi:predicted RecA/RadA family phage recombinase
MRAYGFATAAAARAAGFNSEAGPAMTVIVVTQAQLNAGTFVLDGDPKAIPIYTAPVGMAIEGGYSQPIFLVGGSL